MLKKLLKYDIKKSGNTLFPIYGIIIALALLARIFTELNEITAIFKIPMGFIITLASLATVSVPFITFIIEIDKFNKQITKDEGYLTHTLPVKKQTIISSKLITQIIFQILSIITFFMAIFIISNINLEQIKDLIQEIIKMLDLSKILTFILILALILTGYAVITLLIYAAISFGQKHSTNKGKFAVLYGLLLYIVQQIIMSIVYTPLLTNKKFINELEKTLPSEAVLNISFVISLLVLILTASAYFITTTKNLEKKLNLE